MTRLLFFSCIFLAFSCASDDVAPTTDAERAQLLWNSIQDRSGWGQFSGKTGIVESNAPHEDYAAIYVNEVGMGNLDSPPYGTVIVKLNLTGEDEAMLGGYTVMERIEGYNPAANNWFWAKYNLDGTVATNDAGVDLMGSPGGCIGCHMGSDGSDFVYAND